MIGKLVGVVDSVRDNVLILNVGGAGYLVHAPRRILQQSVPGQNDAADALAVAICEAAMQERNKLLDRALSKRALPEAPRHRASSACESRKGSRS